jgi:hypothetical protein
MRIFISHDPEGHVVGVLKATVLDASVVSPFGELPQDQAVIEVESTGELEALDCSEIQASFKIDVGTNKLNRVG